MPTQLLSDNMELTPSMKVLAEQKLTPLLAHLEQRGTGEPNIRIVMNKDQAPDRMFVKVEVTVEGKTYFGDESDYGLETALIRAIEEVDKQYLKDKEKTKERDYEKNRDMKRLDEEDLQEDLSGTEPDNEIK